MTNLCYLDTFVGRSLRLMVEFVLLFTSNIENGNSLVNLKVKHGPVKTVFLESQG